MFKKVISNFMVVIVLLMSLSCSVHADPTQKILGWESISSVNWIYWEETQSEWEGQPYYYRTEATGWRYIDGYWYYFSENDDDSSSPKATMKTGWISYQNNWYYCYYNGAMAHDCWIDHWYLGTDGAWTGKVDDDSLKQYDSRTYWGLCNSDEKIMEEPLYTSEFSDSTIHSTINVKFFAHKITQGQLEYFEKQGKVEHGTISYFMAQGGSGVTNMNTLYLSRYNPWGDYNKNDKLVGKLYVNNFFKEGYYVTENQFKNFKSQGRIGTDATHGYYLLW